MKRLLPAVALTVFITHANALDLGALKEALKSSGSSATTTSSAGVRGLSNDEASG